MEVREGSTVSVHYEGTLPDGTVFDSSRQRGKPLDFEIGTQRVIPGFSTALIGMSPGETKNVTIPCDDAYGPRDETAVQQVPKTAFDSDFEFKIGAVIQGNGPRGPFLAKIRQIGALDVTIDFNHPLAGHDLNFDIEVLDVSATGETQDLDVETAASAADESYPVEPPPVESVE